MSYNRKELVDWVRGIYQNLDKADKKDALHFFPELRKSEDERIINQLIALVNSAGEILLIPTNKEELVAWLNKCKESLHISETCKEKADSFTCENEEIRQQLLWLCNEWEHNPDRRTIPADIDNIRKIRNWLEKQIKNVVVYDGDSYESAKEKAWHSFSGKAPLVSEAKSIHDNGFSEGYQFGIHEEKPFKWTIHDEAVRKEAIACLEEWKRLIPHSSVEDYYNILNWLKKELSIHTENQKEKKPAKWDEKDESIRKQLISICDEWLNGGYNARPCLDDVRWLKNLLENQKELTTVEWNEEDKDYYDTIIRKLEIIGDDSGLSNNQIKFLREHCPLHRSEWSEEDETIIEGACSALEIHGHTKLASMLKSLRPQPKQGLILTEEQEKKFGHLFSRPSWRPSDEQMNCLCNAVDAAIRKHNESVSGYKPARVLKSLYEDLKKLQYGSTE